MPNLNVRNPRSGLRFALAALALSPACTTLPKDFPAAPSHAVSQGEATTLGGLLRPDIARHPTKSGFGLIDTGREALLTRLALADVAERTIDAQYFIWTADASGVLLMDRVIKAAERGVRVRLLLDDLTSHGKDLGLAVINQHPNIEVRLFNPLGRRYYTGLFRALSMAFHIGRMTNRMHNKLFVVDNQVAVVGGRNIADEYFGVADKSNFRDFDLFSLGPIVAETSQAFDEYWNSPWSVPFEVFKTSIPGEKKMRKRHERMAKEFAAVEKSFPYPLDWRRETVLKKIQERRESVIWAEAEVISDAPDKAWSKAKRGKSKSEVVNRLTQVFAAAEREILVISPYLILSEEDTGRLGQITKKGVSVRILTNSLQSTDALPVVAMYRPIRDDILRAGVGLYETRADAEGRGRHIDPSRPESRLSLHAKTVLLDRRKVFVGTFNVDPRSEHLNTEVGLLVHSEELGQVVWAALGPDLARENSYELRLDRDVVWLARENGVEKTYTGDPHAGFWRRLSAFFLSLLPIKGQL